MNKLIATSLAAIFAATLAHAGQKVTSSATGLEWTPPRTNTDGSVLDDLAGYRVYLNGNMIADTVDSEYVWSELPLLNGETGVFHVVAYDDVGNESLPSEELTVTADLVGPSSPRELTITISVTVQK